MRVGRILLRVHLVAALAAAGGAVTAASAQEAIYLARHAERLDDTTDSPLSAEGKVRAARLGQTLRDAGITAVFATQYVRTADTARPLADALGLRIVQVTAGQNAELLALVRAAGPRARVLIVGHSDTVPELLTLLGHPVPVTIAKAEYDNLFVVVPGAPKPLVLRLRF